jgi:formate dehydrogenase gamma subunit
MDETTRKLDEESGQGPVVSDQSSVAGKQSEPPPMDAPTAPAIPPAADPPTPIAETPAVEPIVETPAPLVETPAEQPVVEMPAPVAETSVAVAPAAILAPEPAAALAETEPEAHDIPHHEREYPRFRLMARIEHMLLLISFTILCLTGLPQKFPFSPISQGLITLMGGIEFVRLIHRWAAIVLVLGSIYHLLTSSYRLFVKHERMRMLPDLKDGFDLRDTVAYNLGFIDEPPKMRKFNFGEKFEYWAVVWGTAVMIVTGFILWNPIAATRLIPGGWIPVAMEAHGWEAVLAAVSIVIWHLYNVLVKHRNKSMFTGVLSHKIMEEEHALELERLEAGGEPWSVLPPHGLARRRRVFHAVASVVAVLAIGLVYWMFTFEETVITIEPAATREVFVPLASPSP